MERRDEICLNELQIILTDFDKSVYSLNGEQDSSICMEYTNSEWTVYECERSAKRELKVFNNVVEAAIDLLKRIAYGEKADTLVNRYIDALLQFKAAS